MSQKRGRTEAFGSGEDDTPFDATKFVSAKAEKAFPNLRLKSFVIEMVLLPDETNGEMLLLI